MEVGDGLAALGNQFISFRGVGGVGSLFCSFFFSFFSHKFELLLKV